MMLHCTETNLLHLLSPQNLNEAVEVLRKVLLNHPSTESSTSLKEALCFLQESKDNFGLLEKRQSVVH